ncbi:MAG: hypothetical protein R2770_16810 [Acidimicrobiales bacterium]
MWDRDLIFQAIRESWCPETCGEPARFTPENPSWQQCDASAFVAWEYLGGDLVLGKVFIDGEQTEHHYWNRIDGEDFDLTRDQFRDGQSIVEVNVIPDAFLKENMQTMKPEVLSRVEIMRTKVSAIVEAAPGT